MGEAKYGTSRAVVCIAPVGATIRREIYDYEPWPVVENGTGSPATPRRNLLCGGNVSRPYIVLGISCTGIVDLTAIWDILYW